MKKVDDELYIDPQGILWIEVKPGGVRLHLMEGGTIWRPVREPGTENELAASWAEFCNPEVNA